MNKNVLTNWKLSFDNRTIPSRVPGDITIDLFNAGLIENPYIKENYKSSTWIGEKDFTYLCEFDVDDELYHHDQIILTFKGIDLFASIEVNDVHLGDSKNAFLAYQYDIKKHVKKGKNQLKVSMKSTLNKMKQIDTTGYFAIFNLPRIFVRKPQCHFGWDWAPKICAYGIIDEVTLEGKSNFQINDVRVVADDQGSVRIHVETNYSNKSLVDADNHILKKCPDPDGDTLIYYVSKTPFSEDYEITSLPLSGEKNYYAFKKNNYQLWWPRGYGEQPLYNYKVELVRGHKVVDSKIGRFGFRSVELKEEAKGDNLIGMDFYINGVRIYLKGSNWVPPECFTGVMEDHKYKELIQLAYDMNVNILRVWGGGAYEKDIFFDLCDEYGILTWQDIALACADIPEDNKEFLDNLLEEVTYQVKRLRNHPSLIYWCGGNEKTGTYGNMITHGDFLVNCTLYGLISHLDDTRPYRRQSPHSYTDIGNDSSSGDSHYGNFETALNAGMKEYRNLVSKKVVPFASECAVLGPSSEETLRKIFPEDHLWPMDEMWKDRFMENPYAAILMDFPHRELYYAEQLHGKVRGLSDFVLKAMSAQSEALRCEAEYSRAHRRITGAWLNWMIDDIWPSGTWAIIDYYLEPKQAYYQLRKSFDSLLVSFYQDKDKKTHLFADYQGNKEYRGMLTYGLKNYSGELVFEKKVEVNVSLDKYFDLPVFDIEVGKEAYFYVKYLYNDEIKTVIYSPTLYMGVVPENKYKYSTKLLNPHHLLVKIKASGFSKSLFIHFPDNFKYQYSDNYIDLGKGDEATIEITSKENIDVTQMKIETLSID